jgi:hypothetical protein
LLYKQSHMDLLKQEEVLAHISAQITRSSEVELAPQYLISTQFDRLITNSGSKITPEEMKLIFEQLLERKTTNRPLQFQFFSRFAPAGTKHAQTTQTPSLIST